MITIKDIAREAGVSVATVSRVINNKSDVSESMRARIKNIMEEAGYIPNTMAKNLSHGRSKLIAVMFPTLNNQFFVDLLTEIEKEANNLGYNIIHIISSDDRKKVEYHLNSIRSNFVSGAIINSLHVDEKDLEKLQKTGIKVLTIDRSSSEHKFSSVNVDHKQGGYLSGEHLISKGCRDIVIVSGADDDKILNLRIDGFKEYISKQKIDAKIRVLHSDLSVKGGYDTFKEFLSLNSSFDGVFCSNDAMALGAMRACNDFDLSVPDDVLVLGYDNSSMNSFSIPRLSSIDQNVSEIGKKSVNALIELIDTESDNQRLTISPTLIERESTCVENNSSASNSL